MIVTDFFHKVLRIPYKLHVVANTGTGPPVVFLHGIASDSATWRYVVPAMPETLRAITIDLLGFGASPKPKNNSYTTKDHATAVVKTLRSLSLNGPAILVGHSMGGLIAVEVAKTHPELVRSLVLISVPIYNPEDIITATSRYATTRRSLSNGLFIAYDQIIQKQNITLKAAQALMKLSPAGTSFTLTKDTWEPFKRSLTNTIMRQTSLRDILTLPMMIHLIHGKLDMLVQQKNYASIMQTQPPNITITNYRGGHMVTKGGAALVVQAITEQAATIQDKSNRTLAQQPQRQPASRS